MQTTMSTVGKRVLNAPAHVEDAPVEVERESPRVRQSHPRHTARHTAKKSRSRSRTKTQSQKLYDKQLTALIIVLLFAAGVTLYSAYIVFRATQRRHQHLPLTLVRHAEATQAVAPSPTSTFPASSAGLPELEQVERYLAYLPHSGYHNQRIALENALVLARVLNRTLLLPPVRLGTPLTYVPFDALYEAFGNSTKAGLEYCSQAVSYEADLPPECGDYMDYTHVSWDSLVDMPSIRSEQPVLDGWNFTDIWLYEVLNISAASGDIFYLEDTTRNQYAFQDFSAPDPTARKFSESVDITTLAHRPERLIQLGTLFGSARLHLRAEANLLLRKRIRERMAFTHPHLVRAASAIRTALGGAYLGAHLRVADNSFEWSARVNVRHTWWKMMHGVLGFTYDEILDMEEKFFPDEDALEPPVIEVDIPALRSPHPPLPPFPADASPAPGLSCRGPLHRAPALQKLNAPLFVATDARNPSLSPLLWRFVRTFPCSFFLDDFPKHTLALGALHSETDGVPLRRFLMPFVDAMVAGQAWQVVGTEQSTFSTFVSDVLWRKYHGFEIVQRGSR